MLFIYRYRFMLLAASLGVVGCSPLDPAPTSLSSGANQSAYARIGEQIQASAAAVNLKVTDTRNSQGSRQNLERLLAQEVDFAITQLDVASEAMAKGEVVAIAILTEEYLHVVTDETSKINRFEHLDNKKVSIGPERSGINFTASRIFQATNLRIYAQNSTLGDGKIISRLRSGQEDALVYVGPLKASNKVRTILSQNVGLRFIPLEPSFINYLTLQFPESYRQAIIPEGTYRPLPQLPSQDILTISTPGALLTRPDVGHDTVALVTWAILSTARQFAPFYPKLAEQNGARHLYEGLIYVHPAAQQTYLNGDPRVAWLRYLQENKPLQAASIMLLSTTTIGFMLRRWRYQQTEKILRANRQAIASLFKQMKQDPKTALHEMEELRQSYRLRLIAGTLAPELYQKIDHLNAIVTEQCLIELKKQQETSTKKPLKV